MIRRLILTASILVLILISQARPASAQWVHFADRNRVRAVELEPGDDILWYATTGGLVRLDRARGVWQAFGRSEGLPTTDLTSLLVEDDILVAGSRDMGLVLRYGLGRWVRLGFARQVYLPGWKKRG